MKLIGTQRKQLHQALLQAFPTHAALTRLVRFHLDQNLSTIAGAGTDLAELVFNLIEWADTQACLPKLLAGAESENPAISKVQVYTELVSNSLQIPNSDPTSFYSNQADAYRFLAKYIRENNASTAILLQYSCRSARDVLIALMEKSAAVTLYLQHEETARKIGSQFQSHRIIDSCHSLRTDLGNLFDPTKLEVRKYRAIASISGIRIDDRILFVGWYIYEYVEIPHQKYAKDTLETSAHDRAGILAWRGTTAFNVLNTTFSEVEANYRRNSEILWTPQSLRI